MKIILEESEKNLKVNVGDIVLLNKDNSFTGLGKSLVDSNHMFFVSRIKDGMIRINVLSSNMNHVSDKFPSNSPVLDWRKSGLNKPSYINGNSNGWININQVRRKVGSLSSRDYKSIMYALKHRTFVNQKIENFKNNGIQND